MLLHERVAAIRLAIALRVHPDHFSFLGECRKSFFAKGNLLAAAAL